MSGKIFFYPSYVNKILRKHLITHKFEFLIKVKTFTPGQYTLYLSLNLFQVLRKTKCEQKIYVSRKTLLVVGLASRRVNLSALHQWSIQEPVKTNTQPQLQSAASHCTLVSPTQTAHQLPDTYLQIYPFPEIFFLNLENNNISRYFD